MKYYMTFIILFSSFSLYCNEDYLLGHVAFLEGESRYNVNLINNPNNNNLFYSGRIENIEETVYINRINKGEEKTTLKDGNHPLVNILNINYIKYINLFSTKTIFIIEKNITKNIKNVYLNYTFFTINNGNLIYSLNLEKKISYVKLGKKLDNTMNFALALLPLFSVFTIIFILFIIKREIINTDPINQLPFYFLIINMLCLLFFVHLENLALSSVLFIIEYPSFAAYISLFTHSFYKCIFYTTIILILEGWATISFFGYREKFKKLRKKIFLYDLIFTFFILILNYVNEFTNKLKLFYIKDLSENCILLCFIIFYIFKIMIPLAKQMKYEQSIRSDLVKTIKFKCKLLLFTIIIMVVYAIFFIISPLIEYKYTYTYIDNFTIHLILQLFYETIFFILLIIVFYPKKLPRNYFDDIVFNYKSLVFLLANIEGKENDNKINDKKLNISNLNYKLLKKFSKKVNYPVVLMNPFTSPKNNSLFNEIHIGTVQRRQKLILLIN